MPDKIICPVMGDECLRTKALELETGLTSLTALLENHIKDCWENYKAWDKLGDVELREYSYGRHNEASMILAFIREHIDGIS